MFEYISNHSIILPFTSLLVYYRYIMSAVAPLQQFLHLHVIILAHCNPVWHELILHFVFVHIDPKSKMAVIEWHTFISKPTKRAQKREKRHTFKATDRQ